MTHEQQRHIARMMKTGRTDGEVELARIAGRLGLPVAAVDAEVQRLATAQEAAHRLHWRRKINQAEAAFARLMAATGGSFA